MDRHTAAWSLWSRLRAACDDIEIGPTPLLGLLVLASAACAGVVVLWWTARPAVDHGLVPPVPGSDAVAAAASDAPAAPTAGADMGAGTVVVHVSGAVATPGVHVLPANARVHDAVAEAGGATSAASTDALNLARPLRDGEQIHVPDRRESADGHGARVAGTAPDGPQQVNLNRASQADLEALPGVGPVLAQRIIAHRAAIGSFTTVDELQDVSGIGERTFEALAPLVTV